MIASKTIRWLNGRLVAIISTFFAPTWSMMFRFIIKKAPWRQTVLFLAFKNAPIQSTNQIIASLMKKSTISLETWQFKFGKFSTMITAFLNLCMLHFVLVSDNNLSLPLLKRLIIINRFSTMVVYYTIFIRKLTQLSHIYLSNIFFH